MWWHGRGNSGGSWLPEDKKNNMCGTEGEIVVAHGRLPSPGGIVYLLQQYSVSPAIACTTART